MTPAQILRDAASPASLVTILTQPRDPVFSVCTLVTNHEEYAVMRASFATHGFDDDVVEYVIVDNSAANIADAYQALNAFLQTARAPYVVICHQDVELVDDGFEELVREVARANATEPAWGVLGNAGSTLDHRLAIRITDTHATNQRSPVPLPVRVNALDENFLLVRRAANLALSRDLAGFHHYGNDICIVADVLGWTSHVIDFHLLHKSGGTVGASFDASRCAIVGKYGRAFRPRIVGGTLQRGYCIGGTTLGRRIGDAVLFAARCAGSARHLLGLRTRRNALGG